MASSSSCVLLFALLGMHLGVQAGMVDNMMAIMGGSQQESTADMPHLASLLQERINNNHNNHASASWKAEANVFLSMLQSMGKQVPEAKRNDTGKLVDNIIALLTNARTDLKTTAQTDVTDLVTKMKEYKTGVTEYDGFARTAKSNATERNGLLTTCYATLRTLQAIHGTGCTGRTSGASLIEEAVGWVLPAATGGPCKRMEDNRKTTFQVSSKTIWTCNFTNGQTDESCVSDGSPLKKDLKDKHEDMKDKYQEWVEDKRDCEEEIKENETKCEDSDKNLTKKIAECEGIFNDASNYLCSLTSSVHTREENMGDLNASMSRSLTVLTTPTDRKSDFLSLSAIVCVFRRFRAAMNFAADDYSVCLAETKDDVFVSPPTIPVRPSTMSIDDIQFGGGLADKYLGRTRAANGRKVLLRVHLRVTQQPKLYLQLAAPSDEESCGVADVQKTKVSATGTSQAMELCTEKDSACKFAELGGNNVRMSSATCSPQADATNAYTILRKVCSGSVFLP